MSTSPGTTAKSDASSSDVLSKGLDLSQRLIELLKSRNGRRFIRHLAKMNSATPTMLSLTLGVTVQQVQELADLFEAAELLVSQRIEDRRMLTITAKGRQVTGVAFDLLHHT